ncbi:MAG TPA: AAA family ATPase, partial [Candidatus Goldiibacteriota bacterium]|nr:AAA family ATPase [Candidatus Goldiibacteriota bacterium]
SELMEALDRMDNPPALMVFGPPGVGKTSIMKEFVETKGYEARVKHLSRMDTTDWSGIPREKGNYTEFLPISIFKPVADGKKKIVIFFDELNTAQPSVLNAALDVILEKKGDTETLGASAKLPPDTIILAAGNLGPNEDGTYVEELSMAVKTRMVQMRLKPDLGQWLAWAKRKEIHPKVIEFIEKKGMSYLLDMQEFKDKDEQAATPRGWERISDFLKETDKMAMEGREVFGLVQNYVTGAIGKNKGEPFVNFFVKPAEAKRAWLNKITTKLAILNKQEITADLKEAPELLEVIEEGLNFGFPEALAYAKRFIEKLFIENAKRGTGVFTALSGVNADNFLEFMKKEYPDVYKKFKEAVG